MANSAQYSHFVVDGSNIATEGRSQPSLEQLNDAVIAFMAEQPDAMITVVVDATFGHRIAKKEVKAFDEAVANNELVTPPAGAIGRGDAFVLTIADKAGAGVLSNDSFQEFHGDYDWLFEEGRLIGGKPVPHVGWVFVARNPVRGPKSRRSVRESKSDKAPKGDPQQAKQEANRRVRAKQPDDAPKRSSRSTRSKKPDSAAPALAEPAAATAKPSSTEHVNELMPFLEFVEHHPVGTSCTATVESYASHGAYARAGDVLIYLPLRLMDDPAPRSARKAVTIGDAMSVVIVGFTPDRRSIDAALPHMAPEHASASEPAPSTASTEAVEPEPPKKRAGAKRAASKKTAAKKSVAKKSSAQKTVAKDAASKKAPAKKTAAKKAPAKKAAATKTTAKKTAAKKTAAKKTAATKSPAKKTAAKKTAATKSPAKKTAAKRTTAKKTAAKKTAAKKAVATKGAS